MNQLELEASIAERDVLRYTPAGVPIVSAILMHSGQQDEAGANAEHRQRNERPQHR